MKTKKISRIRTGGQTGVDRAAMDVARIFGIPLCGWCPKNGWAEDYPELSETPSEGTAQRTEWNMRDADAVLTIIPKGSLPSPGTDAGLTVGERLDKPMLTVSGIDDVPGILAWLNSLPDGIELCVGGPRASECSRAYDTAKEVLSAVFEAYIESDKENDKVRFKNAYFIIGTAYAGKSTMIRLLADKYHGVLCEENYHDRYFPDLDRDEFPCLTYTRDLEDWHDFIRRTPAEYEAWLDGAAGECEILELMILEQLVKQEKPVFVDTNISAATLKKVAEPDHVLVMLADPQISVRRFFDRPDKEKQFLYRLIMEEPDPEKAMENYRQGLMRINSQERYDRLLNSGFPVILRDDQRSIEQTLSLVEEVFGLK